jgi:hypothetical protein
MIRKLWIGQSSVFGEAGSESLDPWSCVVLCPHQKITICNTSKLLTHNLHFPSYFHFQKSYIIQLYLLSRFQPKWRTIAKVVARFLPLLILPRLVETLSIEQFMTKISE